MTDRSWPNTTSENQWIEEARARLIRVVRRIIRNEDRAEELVQVAFVKAVEGGKLSQIRDGDSGQKQLFQWLRIAALNRYREELRRKRVQEKHQASLVTLRVERKDASERKLVCRERIASAIRHLPAVSRKLLLLKYLRGHTQKKISKMLKVSEASVTRLLRKARDEFRMAS